MKRIILLLGVFLTFGCSAKYDLVIKEDVIEEKITLISDQNDVNYKEDLYAQYLDEYPIFYDEEFLYYEPTKKIDGVTYYEKSIVNTEFGYNANYYATFDVDDYQKSRLLNSAFERINIGYDEEEDYYFIFAQDLKIFDYNELLNVININISLDNYEIVESNATIVNNSRLSWSFVKKSSNEDDRIILKYRELKTDEEENNNIPTIENPTPEKEPNSNDLILVIVAFIIFVLLLIIILIFKDKINYNKNK